MVLKYGEIVNSETGLCNVGLGDDIEYYKSIGFVELNVQQSEIDNFWYLEEKCPKRTETQKRILEIEDEKQAIQEQLDELDLKSIRALREGGTNEDGIPYLTFYQNQITKLREKYSELSIEKTMLEENNDITN